MKNCLYNRKSKCSTKEQTSEICLACIGSRIITRIAHLVSHFTKKEIFSLNEAMCMTNSLNTIGMIIGEYVNWRTAMNLPRSPQETQMLKARDELQAFFKHANADLKYRV